MLGTTPVSYFEYDDGWLVVGSGGGRRSDPQWFLNLRTAGRAVFEVGTTRTEVFARVAEGEEYDAVWKVVTDRAPFFDKYRQKAGRPIPVAVLTPV
ncbi:MAG TPA: nitroreductase/quinone reductase family protein [Kribbellaceae bacterium]|jgi:deazaflavin-dependent oxidoreductase (nitroreductase family)